MDIQVNGKILTLNEEQEEALARIKEFIADKDKHFFCLAGYAGVGKSLLIKEAIKNQHSVAVTAPTHKAKKVVARFTGRKAETIHALLGLQPDMAKEEFDKNNVLFGQLAQEKLSQYKLLIVDETSMISQELLTLIKSTALRAGTKVIFMGDTIQLASVGEDTCPVFTDPEIEQIWLTKVMRQQDSNPLMFVYDAIRSDIHSKKDKYSRETQVRADEGIVFYDQPQPFAEKILEVFGSFEYKQDPSIAKILCWRNETVRKWNNYVRKNLYGGINTPLQENEVLMGYKNIQSEDGLRMLIQNSAEYRVLKVTEDVREEILGYWVTLIDIDNSVPSKVFIVKADIENYNKLIQVEQEYLLAAKTASADKRRWKWRAYYQFKNKFLLMENITDYEGNTVVGKDFDFAYALSVHRSQGSTYKYVFVDEKDINNNFDHTERNRLKYVAMSRPTNKAFLLNY